MVYKKNKFRFYALKLFGWMLVVFILQLIFKNFTELFLLNSSANVEVWRYITSIFLHGGFAHLLYNTFALALFGSMLERLVGGKRFLFIFFLTGILANLVSVNFYEASLGASGAIFGVIGALVLIRPLMIVWAFGMPMPLFIAGIIWAVGDILGFFGFSTSNNVANLAHLSGMFFGLIIGMFYRNKAKKL